MRIKLANLPDECIGIAGDDLVVINEQLTKERVDDWVERNNPEAWQEQLADRDKHWASARRDVW